MIHELVISRLSMPVAALAVAFGPGYGSLSAWIHAMPRPFSLWTGTHTNVNNEIDAFLTVSYTTISYINIIHRHT